MIAVLAVFGVVLGAWYMLWLVERVFFGPLREAGRQPRHGHAAAGHGRRSHAADTRRPRCTHGHGDACDLAADAPRHRSSFRDLSLREVLALAPLVVFMFWIGCAPELFHAADEPAASMRSLAAADGRALRRAVCHGRATRRCPAAARSPVGARCRPQRRGPGRCRGGEPVTTETLYLLLPEIILLLFATAIYVGGAFTPAARAGPGWRPAGLLLAGIALYQQQHAIAASSSAARRAAGSRAGGHRADREPCRRAPAVQAVGAARW